MVREFWTAEISALKNATSDDEIVPNVMTEDRRGEFSFFATT